MKKDNLRFLLYLVIAVSLFHYAYSTLKLPFKFLSGSKQLFVDFGIKYYHTQILKDFSKKKQYTQEELYKIVMAEILTQSSHAQSKLAEQAVPHAWGTIAYPPILYILLIPFTYLNYNSAAILWLFLNQILLFFSVYFLIKSAKGIFSFVELAIVIFMLSNFTPLYGNNHAGQICIVTLFLIVLAFYNFKMGRDILAGFLLGLAVISKFIPLLLILFFLIKKEYRVVIAGIITLVIAYAISILHFGLPFHIAQIKYVIPFEARWPEFCSQSLAAFFNRLLVKEFFFDIPNLKGINYSQTQGIIHNPTLAYIMTIVSSLILSGVSIFFCRRKIDRNQARFDLEFSTFITLMLILSPRTVLSIMVLLLIPLFLISHYIINKSKSRLTQILFIISYVLIGLAYWLDGVGFFRAGIFVLLLSGRFYGMLLLWSICLYLLNDSAEFKNSKF